MGIRRSGIILHPTSLPGPHGIGDLGDSAYWFVDALEEMKQSIWQILPLGPIGYGNSPYMCLSAFAGNPLLISLNLLAADRLLKADDLQNAPVFPIGFVDYDKAEEYKTALLAKAADSFFNDKEHFLLPEFNDFCDSNKDWLDNFALFCALKQAHQNSVWTKWEKELVLRKDCVIDAARIRHEKKIRFYKFIQFIFFKQWLALKKYANKKGVLIVGDAPIYVAHDSADVWADPELYFLDQAGNPTVVAGVPPDYYSSTGQRWGNPIYRWQLMKEHGFSWWIKRIKLLLTQVDLIRIDHFRGLEAYWEIPAEAETAMKGMWIKGPGASFFKAIQNELGEVPFIAEDLGVITPEVEALRDQFGLPGMRVLQVAFSTDAKASDYQPHNYIENCVAYTATHDHNTTVGWFTAVPGAETTQTPKEVESERQDVRKYLNSDGQEIHWDMIRAAIESKADFSIYPLQDIMGLGSDARMNRPGQLSSNWQWRFAKEMLTDEMIKRMAGLVRSSKREQSYVKK